MHVKRRRSRAGAAAAAAIALLAASCSEDDEGSLTPVEATRLEAQLDSIRSAADGNRTAAFRHLKEFRDEVTQIDDLDDEQRDALLLGTWQTRQSLLEEAGRR